jgi:hypothetical protein
MNLSNASSQSVCVMPEATRSLVVQAADNSDFLTWGDFVCLKCSCVTKEMKCNRCSDATSPESLQTNNIKSSETAGKQADSPGELCKKLATIQNCIKSEFVER